MSDREFVMTLIAMLALFACGVFLGLNVGHDLGYRRGLEVEVRIEGTP